MKDKYGHEYEELLEIQSDTLVNWGRKLDPAIYVDVWLYCRQTNQPAAMPNDVHRVYRGSELANIIYTWPNLSAAYAPIPSKTEELI